VKAAGRYSLLVDTTQAILTLAKQRETPMRRKQAFIIEQQFCKHTRLPAYEHQIPYASRLNPAIDMTAGNTAKEVI
jgi:hypothetical protein